MSYRSIVVLLTVGLGATGCAQPPVNTLPPVRSGADAADYFEIDVPESLTVKDVRFDATAFSSVSGSSFGGQGVTSSRLGGRAFLQVHAEHRETGEEYLLIYENPAQRSEPSVIVRLRVVPDGEFPPDDRVEDVPPK